MFKWGLVLAGISDLRRPVENVSLFQSAGMPLHSALEEVRNVLIM